MPEGYRFRINWRRKLVLQRRRSVFTGPFGDRAFIWVDAGVEDLVHFFTNQES